MRKVVSIGVRSLEAITPPLSARSAQYVPCRQVEERADAHVGRHGCPWRLLSSVRDSSRLAKIDRISLHDYACSAAAGYTTPHSSLICSTRTVVQSHEQT